MWTHTRITSPLKSPSSVTSLSPASSNGSRPSTPIQSKTSFDQQQVIQPGERIRFSTETSTSRVVEVDELDETVTLMDQFREAVSEQHVHGIVQETKYMLTDPNVLSQEVVVTTSTIIRPSIDESGSASASEDDEGDIASDKAVEDSAEKTRQITASPMKTAARLSPEESPPIVGEEVRNAARQVIDDLEEKDEKRTEREQFNEAVVDTASTPPRQKAILNVEENMNKEKGGFWPFTSKESVLDSLPRIRSSPSPSPPSRGSVTSPLMRQLQYVDERYSSKPSATSTELHQAYSKSPAGSEAPAIEVSTDLPMSENQNQETVVDEDTKSIEQGETAVPSFTPIRVAQSMSPKFTNREAIYPPSETSSARAVSSATMKEQATASSPIGQAREDDKAQHGVNMRAANDLNAQVRTAARRAYVQAMMSLLASIPKAIVSLRWPSIIRYVATIGAFLYAFLSWWRLILFHSSNQTLLSDLKEFFFWLALTAAAAYFFMFARANRPEARPSLDSIEASPQQPSKMPTTTVVEVDVNRG